MSPYKKEVGMLLLGTITIEEVKLIFKMDAVVESIAIVLTAIFTFLAAWAAMKAAKTSQKQLETHLSNVEKINFFGLLDALEKAHKVVFLSRVSLYAELKNPESYSKKYRDLSKNTNKCIKEAICHDAEIKAMPNYRGNTGKSPCVFEFYFHHVERISVLFEFDFIIPNGTDFVILGQIGVKIPIYKLDPDKVVYIADTIANEILGYKISSMHEECLGAERMRCFEYFKAFKDEYSVKEVKSGKEYQYISAEQNIL